MDRYNSRNQKPFKGFTEMVQRRKLEDDESMATIFSF